ncbi:MAG: hypothetical protein ABI591_28725 [Kofleriaceae bacterium]
MASAKRRLAVGGLTVIAVWAIALLVLDVVVTARAATGTAQRIGESLQGAATIGEVDVALIRGRLVLERLAVHRDDVIGHLALDVADVDCELAPLGWALVDRDCSELAVRGVRLEVSTAALFQIKHPKQRPIHANQVMIDDAELTLFPNAFLPSLGKIVIRIDHAESGPTAFVTPMSWIFSLTTLRASIDLPAGLTVHLTYDHGIFGAAGALFGSKPVELPLELPVATLDADAHAEIAALVKLGEDLAAGLVAKRAEDWLRQKL